MRPLIGEEQARLYQLCVKLLVWVREWLPRSLQGEVLPPLEKFGLINDLLALRMAAAGRRLALANFLPAAFSDLLDDSVLAPANNLNAFLDFQLPSEKVQRVLAVHPEGTLYCLLAYAQFQERRYPQAQEASLLALKTPSVFPVRVPALTYAVYSESILFNPPRDVFGGPAVPEMRALAEQHFLELAGPDASLVYPGLRHLMITAAVNCRAFDPARSLVRAWQIRSPNDAGLEVLRIRVDLAEGHALSALKAARALKAKHAGADDPIRQQAEALERDADKLFKEQLQAAGIGAAPVANP
jgi:hypothetical protein